MEEQKISLSTAILLNMNIMIGSGVLIGPGVTAAIAGNASFLVWPLVALLFLPIVLSVIELSRLFPGAGGFYLYTKQGLSETAAFASGWIYIVGYTFAATVETLALHDILVKQNILTINAPLFNALILILVVAFSFLSLKIVSGFLNSLTIVKILPLAILIALLPFIFSPTFAITGHELALLPSSMSLAIFGFLGFEYCVGISHLIKNSEKNAPLAILFGFLGTGALYMLFHFGLLNLMGVENLVRLNAPGFADFITLPIPYLKTLLKILIPTASIVIFFASLIGMINANAILLQKMGQEKLLKGGDFLKQVTTNGRPWVTLILQGIAIFLLATFIPSIPLAGSLTVLGVLASFFLSFISLFIVQKRHRSSKIIITVIALILVVALIGFLWFTMSPFMSQRLIYTAVLATGFIAGMLLRYK